MGAGERRRDWAKEIADLAPGSSHRYDFRSDPDALREVLKAARGEVDVVLQDPNVDAAALGAGMVAACEVILLLGVPMAFDHRGRRFRLSLDEVDFPDEVAP
jgi:hypothetical protein